MSQESGSRGQRDPVKMLLMSLQLSLCQSQGEMLQLTPLYNQGSGGLEKTHRLWLRPQGRTDIELTCRACAHGGEILINTLHVLTVIEAGE